MVFIQSYAESGRGGFNARKKERLKVVKPESRFLSDLSVQSGQIIFLKDDPTHLYWDKDDVGRVLITSSDPAGSAEAEYDFGDTAMKDGDLNHDGVIDQNDLDIFNRYVLRDVINADELSEAEVGFDPAFMDSDGNGVLNRSDMSFIIGYSNLTANETCYRNNPTARYETSLGPHLI